MADLDVIEPLIEVRVQLTGGFRQGLGSFGGKWSERNPWNIPGPVYVGDDDECGTGPDAAPNNVWLPSDDQYVRGPGGEFVYRQPSTSFELRQIVIASETNVMDAYAFDGDDHWTPQTVREWWSEMTTIKGDIRAEVDAFFEAQRTRAPDGTRKMDSSQVGSRWPSAGLRRWLDYMSNGAETYLRRYIAYLEAGIEAAAGDLGTLPLV